MKRKFLLQLEDLPVRSVQLSENGLDNIYGGCVKKNHSCENCSCCGDMKCVYIVNLSIGVQICQ
jgi:hypothetical protein